MDLDGTNDLLLAEVDDELVGAGRDVGRNRCIDSEASVFGNGRCTEDDGRAVQNERYTFTEKAAPGWTE